METALLVLAVWFALALVAAVVVGRSIRLADRRSSGAGVVVLSAEELTLAR